MLPPSAPEFPRLTPTAATFPSPLKRQRLNSPRPSTSVIPTTTLSVPPAQPSSTRPASFDRLVGQSLELAIDSASVPVSSVPNKMDLVSPASPMGLRLTSDSNKSATVFLSHVRRTFARHPVDYTGELVRLLDDIATFTCTTSALVAERSIDLVYGSVGTGSDISASATVRQLYRVLAHDGYCCIVLAKGVEQPLTFDESVLNGNYVVCVSPLDMDTEGSGETSVAGMLFSVYKRKSSTSLPGRGMDLSQKLVDQVAAGYASYSSATTLHYTMGHGVYSFVMHPVALQYFLQPPVRVSIPENPTIVYTDRKLLTGNHPLSAPLAKMVDKLTCSMFTTGCLVGDLHQLIQSGGILIKTNVHLMCEAAPVALIMEQCGGVALDETGDRIMDMAVTDDFNAQVTIVLGTVDSLRNLQLSPAPSSVNGNGSF